MKFYGYRYKIARVGTFPVAVIRGESCFEKNAFEDTENPPPAHQNLILVKEYLGKYSIYRKKNCFVLKLFLRPILFHGKLSFDNLNYFKLYGNLKSPGYHFRKLDQRLKAHGWTQQATTLLGPTMLGVVGQQCWVRLHGPLDPVHTTPFSNENDTVLFRF